MGRIRTLRHLRAASPGGLNLDFTSGALDGRITASGGANGTVVNSSGVLVAANAPRFDYNPSTLSALGLLVEEARTNAIRNNTMVGAVAGTPGTLPTNWSLGLGANPGTLASSVIGTGTQNGIAYIDIRLFGTPAGVGQAQVVLESPNIVTAASGQTWAMSAFATLTASVQTAGVASYVFLVNERSASFLQADTTAALSIGTGALSTSRVSGTVTLGNASTTNIIPLLGINYTAAAVDITLRIGLPQLELGAFADSPVQTSTAAVTRTADSALLTGTNFSSWFNGGAGTFVVQFDVTSTTGTRPILNLDDNSANQQIRLYASGTSVKLTVTNGGVTQADLTLGTITAGSVNKVAFTYAAADFAAVLNGGTVQTAASGTVPTVDRARLGSDQAGNVLNGHDRSLRFVPNRQPNASLQSLST